jgi:hypothetical protein
VSEEFEVVPANVTVSVDPYGILASLKAPPHGYRLIDIDGSESGDNPLVGPITVHIEAPSGSSDQSVEATLEGTQSRLAVTVPADWTYVSVTDAYGNTGATAR